jgi:hypothetical protein
MNEKLWARIRYNKLVVHQYTPQKGVVQLQVVDGEELIALPQEIFFEEGSEVYLEPSIKDMFNWRDPLSGSTYKVHEINDNIGYVIYVPDDYHKTGIYYLVPAEEYYSVSQKDLVNIENQIDRYDFLPGTIFIQRSASYTNIIISKVIQGWNIAGPVSGGIEYLEKDSKVLSGRELSDPARIDRNLKSRYLVISFNYKDIDILVEARHLTLFYR